MDGTKHNSQNEFDLLSLPFEHDDELLLYIVKNTLSQLKASALYLFETKPDEIKSRLILNSAFQKRESLSFNITKNSHLFLLNDEFIEHVNPTSEDKFIRQIPEDRLIFIPVFDAIENQMGSIVITFKSSQQLPNQKESLVISKALIYFYRAHLLKERQVDSEQLLFEIAQFAKIGYWYRDMVSDRVIWSKETFEIFGEDPFSFHPTVDQYYEYLHPNDFLAMKEAEKTSVIKNVKLNIDHRIILKSDEVRWIHLQGQLRRDQQGNPIEFFGLVQDITEQKEREVYLQHISNTDFLTGLKNRRGFLKHLEQTIIEATERSHQFYVTYIDLDYFKEINDIYGHEVGDFVLSQFGKRLTSLIPQSAQLARIGGDEFAIITNDSNEHNITVSKIFSALNQPFELSDIEVTMSASMGSAIFPDHALTATGLLSLSDDAMFFAKREGKNKFRLFEAEIQLAIERSATIRKKLANVCENRQGLSVAYQPIKTRDSNTYSHYECLLRWTDLELGSVSPVEFIPIAEESGLIHHLTDFVVKQILQDLKAFQSRFNEDIVISINLSAYDLCKPSSGYSRLLKALQKNPDISKHITVEYTETALLDNESMVLKNLTELRSLGIRIALDDFGTGFSSMAHCHKFPIDIIKIDKSFVQDYHDNDASKNIVDCIFYMAKILKLDVIAEGVEDARTVTLLGERVFGLQGYYFAKPAPLKSFLN